MGLSRELSVGSRAPCFGHVGVGSLLGSAGRGPREAESEMLGAGNRRWFRRRHRAPRATVLTARGDWGRPQGTRIRGDSLALGLAPPEAAFPGTPAARGGRTRWFPRSPTALRPPRAPPGSAESALPPRTGPPASGGDSEAARQSCLSAGPCSSEGCVHTQPPSRGEERERLPEEVLEICTGSISEKEGKLSRRRVHSKRGLPEERKHMFSHG